MSEQVGPETRHIPAATYQSCSGCVFYKSTLYRSGHEPLYKRDCKHPAIPEQQKFDGMWGLGNLGSQEQTPEWCPVLTAKKDA